MTAFLKTHGNGFWLHMLGAGAIMALGWLLEALAQAFYFNTLLWPVREFVQKTDTGNWRGFFTVHVWLEWVPAVMVGGLIYGVLQ